MTTPFPGMDPYLEHPILWEGVHARLINSLADQLQPRLDPRYVTSIEERVFIEGPQRRIPDLWVQRSSSEEPRTTAAATDAAMDSAVILEVEELEVRHPRLEILDACNEMKLIALIELVSPTNKASGPGRDSYLQKQQEILEGDAHLIEIDLLRKGDHIASVPERRLSEMESFDYLVCVNRWPARNRFELHPRRLRERLPRLHLPLSAPDPDVLLDIQAALDDVYLKGRYMKRVRYHEPCVPPLTAEDQQWANERWAAYQAAHADFFPHQT